MQLCLKHGWQDRKGFLNSAFETLEEKVCGLFRGQLKRIAAVDNLDTFVVKMISGGRIGDGRSRGNRVGWSESWRWDKDRR